MTERTRLLGVPDRSEGRHSWSHHRDL